MRLGRIDRRWSVWMVAGTLGYKLAQGYHFGRPVTEPDHLGISVAATA